jgi:hypothetical protein
VRGIIVGEARAGETYAGQRSDVGEAEREMIKRQHLSRRVKDPSGQDESCGTYPRKIE